MKNPYLFFTVSVLVIFNLNLIKAQTEIKEDKGTNNRLKNEGIAYDIHDLTYWINGGIGGSSSGLSGGLSISARAGKSLFSLRYINSSKYGESWLGGYTTPEIVWEISPLYGLIAKGKWVCASISGGLGLVAGTKHGKFLGISSGWINTYEKVPVATVGIPLEIQLFFTPTSFFGIGVNGFANLNAAKPYSGILICIQFGKLR
jgi:hypothetical protein